MVNSQQTGHARLSVNS